MRKCIMELTWQEINEIDKTKAIMILGLAPIEQHGKHLPLGVDVYQTNHWRNLVIADLNHKGYKQIYTMPTIPFGVGVLSDLVGNIYVQQSTLYNVVTEILECVVKWGFNNIIFMSGHADPIHSIIIEKACNRVNTTYGIKAIAPMGAIFSGSKVGIKNANCEQIESLLTSYPHDYHAGWIETSNMLDYNSDLVKDNYTSQPDIIINPRDMLNSETVRELSHGFGHLGYPQHASKELGEMLNHNIAKQVSNAIICFVKRKNYQRYQHHFLYNSPFIKLNLNEGGNK